MSNVISVSGYSGDVLPTTVFVNFFPDISALTVPLSPTKRGFSIEKPESSFIEPVKTNRTCVVETGISAEAPKLAYCPLPKKYSPYPFDAVNSFAGKNGCHAEALKNSALKYCGPSALSFPFPPKDELKRATELNDSVSP